MASRLFPVFLIPKASLLLQLLKLTRHAHFRHQVQNLLHQTLTHQLICEARGEMNQIRTMREIKKGQRYKDMF